MTATTADFKVGQFREMAAAALETSTGTAVLDTLTALFSAEVHSTDARVQAASDDVVHSLGDARLRADMLNALHSAYAQDLMRIATLSAHLKGAGRMVEHIRALAMEAERGGLDAVALADVRTVLEEPIHLPSYTPIIGALYVDHRHAIGTFQEGGGEAIRSLPFAGWGALVATDPMERWIEPVFYMDSRLLPVSTIAADYDLKLINLQ